MKRIISVITITAVLLSLLAASPVSAVEDSNLVLKKAIEIAKKAFNFDTANLDFNSNYSETKYGRKLWYLNWYSKTGNGSSISVAVDAATGEIVNMNQWENSSAPAKKIPKYTREDAIKAAEELAKRLHPDKFKETELIDEYRNNYYRPYYGNDIYSFYFMRKIDGIGFQDNGMQIQVDKNTLKVRSFSLEWDTVIPIPDAKKAIKADEAKKIYAEKLGLELAYQMVYPNSAGDPKLILIYKEKNSSNPIDALTGDIVTQRYNGPMYEMQEKYALAADSRGNYVPTPQEQKVIDNNSKYISKEKAIEIIKKYVTIDSKLTMNDSNLYSSQNAENATWSISWSYRDKVNNTYIYIYGAVDAVTGEIKNFNINSSENEYKPGTTPKYTKKQCREIAEKFIKEIQPAKFSTLEYREQYNEAYIDPQNVRNYNMNFIRKENGIPVPFNSLNVTVSAYTGKVIGFNMNWQNLKFPDSNATISLEAAYKTLYAKHDLTLKYIRIYNYDKYNENMVIKLAYMLDNMYGMIDAKSGQFIDYSGKPINEANKVSFTDIAGHKSEKEIKLLVELGIINSTENKFNPDAKIFQKDFVKFLMKATQPDYYSMTYTTSDSNEYDRYYENAIVQNILNKKDKKPEACVTRMEASKMMINALGVGFVADLGSIFKLDFEDAAGIAAENKGYAAITAALGIVDTSSGSFGPTSELTRAETAGMLIKYLMVDKVPNASEPTREAAAK